MDALALWTLDLFGCGPCAYAWKALSVIHLTALVFFYYVCRAFCDATYVLSTQRGCVFSLFACALSICMWFQDL